MKVKNISVISAQAAVQVLFVLVFSLSSFAAGKTTAEFLKLGAGARAGALGGAYSALADEPTAIYWNPAALAKAEGSQLSLMHAVYIESSFFDHVALTHHFSGNAAIGLGVQYFSAGAIPQMDETGSETGAFTPSDMAVSLGYGLRLESLGGLALGANAKFIQSKIIDSATTAAADIGLLSPGFFNDQLRLGLSISNLGGKMTFDKISEDLPVIIRAGLGWNVFKYWSISLDLDAASSDKTSVAAGTEVRIPFEGQSVALRGGLSSKTLGEIGGFTGFAFGLGWKMQALSFDYAIAPLGNLGMNHRVSVGVKF